MKKYDLLWALVIAGLLAVIAIPTSRGIIIAFTSVHPYIGGFIKFAILASIGELLALRIGTGKWSRPVGFIYRAAVWGFLGIVIALIFPVFAGGVNGALEKGLLPGQGSTLAFAFFTSLIMNLTFGPSMMIFHRLTDTYIDLRFNKSADPVTVKRIIQQVDWPGFYSFVIFKTIPFFWIPAHTITFMLPPEYRVLMAAVLSLALGLLLSLAKKL